MNFLRQTAAWALVPLAVGAFVTGSAAAAEPKIEELKDYCGEIHQIITEARGYMVANQAELLDKKSNCQKLVFGLTGEALKDVATKGVGASALKDLVKALKELAETLGLPEGKLEEAAEKAGEKIIDAAKKEAKERLKKAVKKYFEENPTIKKYTATGSTLGCDYTMTVTWDTTAQTFSIRTTGDCKCKTVKTANGEGKISKWQSTVKGSAVVNVKYDAGNFSAGLDVDGESYSGAGICDCDVKEVKTKPRRKKTDEDASYTKPSDGFAISIGVGGGGGEHRGRERERDRDIGRSGSGFGPVR
jgi:hypothetical protein